MQELLSTIDLSALQQLLERGGPVVLIIGIMSIAALTVALLKFVQFIYLGVGRNRGASAALSRWISGHHDDALRLASKRVGSAPRVLSHAMQTLRTGAPESAAREESERYAQDQLANLRRHLRVLEATSQIAPLLGLFGTVLGMMSAFQALQAAGADADPAALAGGIWVALITTAVRLAVAIPAGLVLHWFEGRIEKETEMLESVLSQLFTGPLVNPLAPDARIVHEGAAHAAE